MSRNVELLAQIESEAGTKSHRLSADSPFPTKEAAPDVENACDKEILHLVQRLFLSLDEGAPRHVVFCGIDSENGSSSVCAGVGRTLASRSSRSVCLLDANLRSARLSAIFGLDKALGPPATPSLVRERCVPISHNLWFAGTDLLADHRGVLQPISEVNHLLKQLRGMFDYVLIDAPGAGICGDAMIIGQAADAAVLVVEAGITRRLTARNAKESLEASGVRLIGTVLRNRSFPIPERLYKML